MTQRREGTPPTNPSAATAHLICGPSGAGKSTYAQQLAKETDGVIFSIDEWMVTLFGQDAPTPLELQWVFARVARCEGMIWSLASEVAARGLHVILDLSFQRADQRATFTRRAVAAGLVVQLHVLDAPFEERWKRVSARNLAAHERGGLVVTEDMFRFAESLWEPLGDVELSDLRSERLRLATDRYAGDQHHDVVIHQCRSQQPAHS